MTDPIEYLLNAMENAASQDKPAEHGYGAKRRAVRDAIRELRAEAAIAYAQGVKDERERCQQLCVKIAAEYERIGRTARAEAARECADAIRRGEG